jgi:hypothetical protein
MEPLQVFLLGLMVVTLGGASILIARFYKPKATREREIKEEREALKKAVAQKTHDSDGFPLCRVCGENGKAETRATELGFRIERNEGFLAWVRQQIGAPARLRVTRRFYDGPQLCSGCASVLDSIFRSYLLGFEQWRRDQIRDGEIEHRWFERTGCYEQANKLIAEHEKEAKRKASARKLAPVVPFAAAENGK